MNRAERRDLERRWRRRKSQPVYRPRTAAKIVADQAARKHATRLLIDNDPGNFLAKSAGFRTGAGYNGA